MQRSKFIMFLVLDLIILIAVFLIFIYFGILHLLLLFIGAVILISGIYDISTGVFSELFRQFLNLPSNQSSGRNFFNIIPLLLALIITWHGIHQLLEHGFINRSQLNLMQENYFLIALLASSLLILVLAVIVYRGRGRK